jgi:hypothetical protein
MKKLIGALVALFATTAFGATLNPVQSLNPAGSTAGQAVVSTGPTNPPTWGAPTFTYPSQAANTDLANTTGSSAAPTAVAIPSCSTSSSAIDYTSGTGWGCNTSINAATLGGVAAASYLTTSTAASTYAPIASPTFTGTVTIPSGASISGYLTTATASSTYAPLASPTFTGTVTAAAITASGLISPTSTVGIKGTTTNDSAQAGSWGQLNPATVTGTAITNNNPTNCASQSFTAGQWMVMGVVLFTPSAASPIQLIAGANTVSNTLPATGLYSSLQFATSSLPAGGSQAIMSPPQVFQLASTTTVYLIGQMGFGSGTATCSGYITSYRMR